jgi:mannose-1-phosphate guanylyltransferase/mannose-1-phosphate guanylyltransferase/mannose-6-phosphate isomerase
MKSLRPWGFYEVLYKDETCQIKRIQVNPGHQTSLQSHQYRSEHWIVQQGRAKVTLEGDVTVLNLQEVCFVPATKKHRLSNKETVPLVIIEIQTGTYFGEDDIIRFQDDYDRDGISNAQ